MEKHRHDFKEVGEYLVCDCGKKILNLKPSQQDGLLQGVRGDGKKYSVRDNRMRYFFPDEWINFIKIITDKKHRFFFITALHTGARIMEVLHIKYGDIDIERETVILKVVKQRKAKKNFYATGKSRHFFIASEFIKEFKAFKRGKTINKEDYIFLDKEKLPAGYKNLENKEKKKYYSKKISSYSKLFKRKLEKAGVEDYWNFSPHNIRKTYGNWMKVFNIKLEEICYRMGHDMETFMNHYGSSMIFTQEERRKIMKIMGEVK